jgi:serine/threonine protein kinase
MAAMLHSALPPAEDLTLVTLADIARGGMGMVQLCRATDGRLSGQALAVKRLNPSLEEEPEFVNMFLDETWITATIASPHVVRAEAWGRDNEGLFLAVELVEGVSLSRLIKESKEKQEPFAERTVANIASQVCAGLVAAHELRGENGAPLGLVHRDLTPGNILVSFDGIVKIADFGIAKAEERLTNTRIGMMKGKPAYMAPEQARGGGIDARADLFALGVVIFELLAGRRPWVGTNDLETLVAVTTKEPPSILEFRKVSPIFVELVTKCLRKNPKERFGSASELKEQLDAWRRERGFESDDQASFGAFVQRNTPMQQAWFREALGGALVSGGVTFMDLEAKIDKARKAADAAARSGPQPSGAAPTSGGSPMSGSPGVASGPYPGSSQGSRGGATVAMTAASFGQGQPMGSLQEADDEAKTQFLESRGPHAAMAAAQSAQPDGIRQTLSSASASSQAQGGFGSTVAISHEQAAAMNAAIAAADARGFSPAAPPPPTGGRPSPPEISVAPITPPTGVPETLREPPPRGGRPALLVLLLLMLLVGGAALYYFVIRPRI